MILSNRLTTFLKFVKKLNFYNINVVTIKKMYNLVRNINIFFSTFLKYSNKNKKSKKKLNFMKFMLEIL